MGLFTYLVLYLFALLVQNKEQHVVKHRFRQRQDRALTSAQPTTIIQICDQQYFLFFLFKTPVSHADYKEAVMALSCLILSLRYRFFLSMLSTVKQNEVLSRICFCFLVSILQYVKHDRSDFPVILSHYTCAGVVKVLDAMSKSTHTTGRILPQ